MSTTTDATTAEQLQRQLPHLADELQAVLDRIRPAFEEVERMRSGDPVDDFSWTVWQEVWCALHDPVESLEQDIATLRKAAAFTEADALDHRRRQIAEYALIRVPEAPATALRDAVERLATAPRVLEYEDIEDELVQSGLTVTLYERSRSSHEDQSDFEARRRRIREREDNGGKQLPPGRLGELSDATGKTGRELQYRAKFAGLYESEKEVRNVFRTFGSWHEIVKRALPRVGRGGVAVERGS